MRYTEIDLQCEDIMWFGIDSNGYIAAFTSGGSGNIPEFVCRSKEETDYLVRYFTGDMKTVSGVLLEHANDGSILVNDAISFAHKGVFTYDVSYDEGHTEEYRQIAVPTQPIAVDHLPDDIRKVLSDHFIECDLTKSRFVRVQHAY